MVQVKTDDRMRRPKTMSQRLALAVGALALAACGSESGADTSGGELDPNLKQDAQAEVSKLTDVPESRELVPLTETPPPGKTVAVITCPIPSCTESSEQVTTAAELLGWTTEVIVNEFTPESFASAFDSALQINPDFVYYIQVQPETTVSDQLQEFKDRGIPVIANSPGPDTEIGGDSPTVGAVSYTLEAGKEIGTRMAQVLFADAETLDNITLLYDPGSPAYITLVNEFVGRIEDAGGSVEKVEIDQTDVGNALPGQVVSHLQRNPDTEYLVAAQDDMLLGVPDAIEAAGLSLPKIVGQTPGAHTLKYLENGQQMASVVPDAYAGDWDAIDIMARLSIGQEVDNNQPYGNMMIATEQNVQEVPSITFPGVPDVYKDA